MAILPRSRRLKKDLSLLDVYAIATGTTLSAGFFLLPGLAAEEAGPAMVLSYLIAAVPMIPAMFCAVELGTAMPRAGGAYYFLDRSLGPLAGSVGGLGTWLALTLKTAFALIGMGFMLDNATVPLLGPNAFGHAGAGGSLGQADPDTGVGYGYVMNQMSGSLVGDPRTTGLTAAVTACLS